jgi:hypothetical protein
MEQSLTKTQIEKHLANNGWVVLAYTELEEFTKKLNAKPSKVDQSQGFESVPIDTVETELDEDFAGLWQTENFRWQVVANEIVGTIDLLVFHPVAKTWIRKTGSASVMIQQEKGAAIDDISKKYKNTLVKDFPKLEVMCIKSAAKKLGEKYGRSLNRKWIDNYETIYTEEIEANQGIDLIGEEMGKCKTAEDLVAIWNQHPDLHGNGHFKKHFSSHKSRIKLQTK